MLPGEGNIYFQLATYKTQFLCGLNLWINHKKVDKMTDKTKYRRQKCLKSLVSNFLLGYNANKECCHREPQ